MIYCSTFFWNFSVKQEGQIGKIEKITIHPGYQHPHAYNDLAVIKIQKSKGNLKTYTLIIS